MSKYLFIVAGVATLAAFASVVTGIWTDDARWEDMCIALMVLAGVSTVIAILIKVGDEA